MACKAVLLDPYFEGELCLRKAKFLICSDPIEGFIHPRCGTHSKNDPERIRYREGHVEFTEKLAEKEKLAEEEEEEEDPEAAARADDLLKKLADPECKTRIPDVVLLLCNEMDCLNYDMAKAIKRGEELFNIPADSEAYKEFLDQYSDWEDEPTYPPRLTPDPQKAVLDP
ncbi:hypothetical protein BY458DRAFT_491773 [Sporodiniella umbellata]|nr:hypothetical protein BY458DRAFT_491773 [Sporodiniella umbellata]